MSRECVVCGEKTKKFDYFTTNRYKKSDWVQRLMETEDEQEQLHCKLDRTSRPVICHEHFTPESGTIVEGTWKRAKGTAPIRVRYHLI